MSLHCMVVKCPDVSEKHTCSIFTVTDWPRGGSSDAVEGNVVVTLRGLRECGGDIERLEGMCW